MSGHSKWATTHRQKEAKDAKRGQIFTKMANAITVAVRAGGGVSDPAQNFRLRLAIDKAHSLNMPKENVERAIARGSGGGGSSNWEEVSYEGYGPGGIALLIEAATDNKNRTTAEIKNLLERSGGRLAGPGSVSYLFERWGLLLVKKEKDSVGQMLKIMELPIEDVEESEDKINVFCRLDQMEKVRDNLADFNFLVIGSEAVLKPKTSISLGTLVLKEKLTNLIESLEDREDIQRVFSNAEI